MSNAKTATQKQSQRDDAVGVLLRDHRIIEKLFGLFTAAQDRRERKLAAHKICKVLAVHMTVEEELLYPAAHRALQDDDGVHEAEVEHTSAKVLIADIESLSVTDEKYDATVKVLCEYISHHVKEEEKELFPQLRRTDLDLDRIGGLIAARRIELLAQAGIEESDLPTPGREPSRVRKKNGVHNGKAAERLTARSRVRERRLQH